MPDKYRVISSTEDRYMRTIRENQAKLFIMAQGGWIQKGKVWHNDGDGSVQFISSNERGK